MLKRFLPRQNDFFKLFQRAADTLLLTTTEFSHLLQNLDQAQHYVDVIAQHELAADKIAHTNFELMHKSFITPFDRYDIYELTSALDDIMDLIHRISQRFPFYQLKSVPTEMIELAHHSVKAASFLQKAIYNLHSLKNSSEIFQCCKAIDEVESAAHQIVLAGEKKLFLEENNFKEFFKLKEIYAHTKLVINRCQDVGNLLKGIILEYS